MAKKKNEAAAEITVENVENNEKTENAAETAKTDTAAETVVAVPSEEKADEKKSAERKPRKAASSEKEAAEKAAKTTKGRKARSKGETSAVEDITAISSAPAVEETPKKTRRGKAKAADAAEKTSSDKKTVSSRKTAANKKKNDSAEAEKPKRAVRASKAKETVSPYDATVKLVSNKVCKIRTAKKDFAAQFTLTGSAEGVFFVKCEGGKVAVEPWDYKDADINVTVDNDTLKKLIDGKSELYKAVEKGLIEMTCGVNSQGEANSKLNLSTIVALKKILFN